jgi:DNA-binding MarR family transcriptional regulator
MPEEEFRRLAAFRMLLRRFQSFSEQAAEAQGLTSPQYQSLLAIKAHEGPAPFTVTVLAQRLLIKHNSAVGLVDRIEQLGLAVRTHPQSDRRSVVLRLTPKGKRILNRLAAQHRLELQRIAPELGRHADHFSATISTSG